MAKILAFIQRIPNLLLGFIVLCLVLLVMVYQNPPTSLCDIQMEGVRENLVKGFFKNDNRGRYMERVNESFDLCMQSNSPGGCYDVLSRFDYFEEQVRTVPTECGPHPSAAFVQGILAKGLRLLAQIGWGGHPPVNQYNKTAWLDTADLGLFCRLSRQYIRLYGFKAYNGFAWSVLATLPEAKDLPKKELWDKGLFSYPCKGLY